MRLQEGTRWEWLYEVLSPHAERVMVTAVQESRGPKDDEAPARSVSRLTLAGSTAGLVAPVPLTRLVDSLLFGVSAVDAWPNTVTLGGMLDVALATAGIPAMRAARTDPAEVLGGEQGPRLSSVDRLGSRAPRFPSGADRGG